MRLGGPLPPQVQTFHRFPIRARLTNEAVGPGTCEPCQTLNGHLSPKEEVPTPDGKLKQLVRRVKASPAINLPAVRAKGNGFSPSVLILVQTDVFHVVSLVTNRSIAPFQAKVETKVKERTVSKVTKRANP